MSSNQNMISEIHEKQEEKSQERNEIAYDAEKNKSTGVAGEALK